MIPALIISAIKHLADTFSEKRLIKKSIENPTDSVTLMKLAITALKKDEYSRSLLLFKQHHGLEPTNKISGFYCGLLSLRLKDFENAKSFFTNYLSNPIIKPKGDIESEIYYLLPECYYYLGYAYFKLGDFESAEENKKVALSKDKKISRLKLF